MNWDAIGGIGDAIGGIGVVATLLYLALQTRQNTRAVRAASFHQVADSLSDVSMAVLQDPSLVTLIDRVNSNSDSLAPEEIARYGFFLLTTLRRIESLFFHAEQGTIEEESWRGTQHTLHVLLASNVSQSWWTANAARFNGTFRAHIDKNVLRAVSGTA